MKRYLLCFAVLTLCGAAYASDFDRLMSADAKSLASSSKAVVPSPKPPARADEATEYRAIRVCSYMFSSSQGGPGSLGLFAFDLDAAGRVCEIPFYQGHPYGAYRCESAGNLTAPAGAGSEALLFKAMRGDGSFLYHQLNVPSDFAGLDSFRGKMVISGKPPEDLSKPLGASGTGVRSISCKLEKVEFKAD